MDPITALLGGGGALFGGLMNLFDNPEEEQRQQLLALLGQQEGKIGTEYKTAVADLNRQSEMAKKQRRGITEQVNVSRGINDPNQIYSNEEDVINAQDTGMANLSKEKMQALDRITQEKAGVISGTPGADESGFSRFLGGAFEGAGTGMNLMTALQKLRTDGKDPKDTNKDLPGPKTDSPQEPKDLSQSPDYEFNYETNQFEKKKKKTGLDIGGLKLKGLSNFKENNNLEKQMDDPYSLNYTDVNFPTLRLR
jgi:hypothetical protein